MQAALECRSYPNPHLAGLDRVRARGAGTGAAPWTMQSQPKPASGAARLRCCATAPVRASGVRKGWGASWQGPEPENWAAPLGRSRQVSFASFPFGPLGSLRLSLCSLGLVLVSSRRSSPSCYSFGLGRDLVSEGGGPKQGLVIPRSH